MTPDRAAPTVPPPEPSGLASVLERNIRALEDRRRREEQQAGRDEKLAAAITRFTGSMAFVWLHLALVALWVAVNVGVVPGLPRFDPTFVILATVASVEAIFLSTFVLISQNRQAAIAERRAELDLQISLLAEHEITRTLSLVSAMAQKLGVEEGADPELHELKQNVAPEAVLDELEAEDKPSDRKRGRS
ncbi:MAG TPA: DUF1003 domain-containing protein [Caulobacteraceae bacterium]|nr:DUF1003 domain-containing protein [Caulobacteraceae bacterium]